MTPILHSGLPIVRHLGAQAYRASSFINLPECLKTNRFGSVISRRNLSETLVHSLYDNLKAGREALLHFIKLTSLQKAELLTCASVSQHVGNERPISVSQLQQS